LNISKETFNFFHAYRHTVNAELFLSDIIKSGNVQYEAKNMVRALKRRIDANITGLRLLLPAEVTKVLDKEMLDPEVTMQIDNINNMLAELPKAIRDQMENHIEGYHKVYKQK
jgi:hypothetical protein